MQDSYKIIVLFIQDLARSVHAKIRLQELNRQGEGLIQYIIMLHHFCIHTTLGSR